MLKYKQIHYTEILKKFPGFEDEIDLEDYLSSRPDVLENIDLFAPNCRTKDVDNSFKDFKKVDKVDKDTVIVIGLYLEILIFGLKPQYMCYVIIIIVIYIKIILLLHFIIMIMIFQFLISL